VTHCSATIRRWPAPRHAAPSRPASHPATSHPADSGRMWLRNAIAALALLAAAAAVVSWDAQYVMVRQARHVPVIAALEAGIPDTGALIFAALGIALALHGRRALRPRTLNVACVGLSLTMNAIAAGPGWRDTAIWVMPAAVYALASDTLIGVVRAWALARMHATGQVLEGEETTPLAVAGAMALWLLRLTLAPASTLTGKPHKQDLLIALASQRYDLRRTPLNRTARIATQIAAEIGLHPGTARRILRAHVQALHQQPTPLPVTEARS